VEGGVEGGVAGEEVGAGAADNSSSCSLSSAFPHAYACLVSGDQGFRTDNHDVSYH